jgi:predicted ATPase
MRSRDADGPISIEVKYRETGYPVIAYHLEVREDAKGPFVSREWLRWTRKAGSGRPFNFLDFSNGIGYAVPGDLPSDSDDRVEERLTSRELLAINTLGQFEKHPRASALRKFITGWHLSYLTADNTRGVPEAGPQERLSQTGDNLPNVIQYLKEQHPERLQRVFDALRRRVPRLEKVDAELLTDGRLLLQIKDAPFAQPILAKFASDGTLKMLAYLTLLYDPDPPQLIGIEEPENQLHPRLLPELAEECRNAAARSQLMTTTHSPFFANGLRPEELWVLYRDEKGFTRAKRTGDIPGVTEFIEEGAQLGQLWMEGHFRVGDPLTHSGMPASTPETGRKS